MSRFLRFLGRAERPAPPSGARPSYAHHIHAVRDLRTGEVVHQRVQVTERDQLGRIRTTRVLTTPAEG